jgi:hypothetical protein
LLPSSAGGKFPAAGFQSVIVQSLVVGIPWNETSCFFAFGTRAWIVQPVEHGIRRAPPSLLGSLQ